MMTNIEISTLEIVREHVRSLNGIEKALTALAKLKALELKSTCPDSVAMIDQIMSEIDDS